MTNAFISKAERLPPGETAEQHAKWQQEEADAVQQDKDNQDPRVGGLFRGCFRPTRHPPPSLRVIRDQEDGVDRCPLCSWELEDGECQQCGLFFDENGEPTWGDSFTGFSDMDEMSERDLSGEDLDADMDLEDGFDGYDEQMEGWQDYLGDEGSFMMQRFLEHGIPPQAFRARRPLTHSEAGSRRSYSQSIISDMYADEMDTVEEEDEDGVDEDSSMNDFIDDEAESGSTSPSASSSTPGQTPQAPVSRPRPGPQGRPRRVVESEASSTISSIAEEEDDEEDQGPIRRGQRSRASRVSTREPTAPPSIASTEASAENELDEDRQALLHAQGWLLQHDEDEPEEEMAEEDDDSDGGRTTVGWDATAISNERLRMGGSLTPTADRPRPNAPIIRPPSRAGNPRILDASRGLRRRSSVLSNANANYEDGEADDDDSDLDQDGDIAMMAMNSLRTRRSQIHIRNSATLNRNAPTNPRFAHEGLSHTDPIELDTDNSDNSQPGNLRSAPRTRHQEYNPRISWMFADHQRTLEEFQRTNMLDLESRSTTPITRPRTGNRGRPSPAQQYSPFMPPAPPRLRTPQMNNSSNNTSASRLPTSPPRRAAMPPIMPITAGAESGGSDRAPSVGSNSTASSVILTPGTSTPTSQQSVNSAVLGQSIAAIDMADRPLSRLSARPPSAAGRRGSAGFSPVYPGFPHNNVGLNIQGRILQHQRPGNPWAYAVQGPGLRPRTSRPALRDQSSVATLRPVNSRANIRDSVNPSPVMRPQVSRVDLRHQSSRRRLNNQSSTRTLRASEHARPPQSPVSTAGSPSQAASRPARFTADERESLARELVNNRMRALEGSYQAAPVRTNPFTAGFRRPNTASDDLPVPAATNMSQHVRSNSNGSSTSANSSSTAQVAPSAPAIARRRSNRNMLGGGSPVSQPVQRAINSLDATYTNNYLRAGQGSLVGGSSAYQSPLNANTRNSMVAATGSLI
jgi:hypothetical protein